MYQSCASLGRRRLAVVASTAKDGTQLSTLRWNRNFDTHCNLLNNTLYNQSRNLYSTTSYTTAIYSSRSLLPPTTAVSFERFRTFATSGNESDADDATDNEQTVVTEKDWDSITEKYLLDNKKMGSDVETSDEWFRELEDAIEYWSKKTPLSFKDCTKSYKLFFDVYLQNLSLNDSTVNESSLEKVRLLLYLVLRSRSLCYRVKLMKKTSKTLDKMEDKNVDLYKSSDIWAMMQAMQVIPDVRCFTVLLTGMAVDYENSEVDPNTIIDYMKQSDVPEQHPNVLTYRAALTVWVRRSERDSDDKKGDLLKAKQLWDRTLDFIGKPHPIMIARMMEIYMNYEEFTAVRELFDKYHTEGPEYLVCYAIMVRSYMRSAKDRLSRRVAHRFIQEKVLDIKRKVKAELDKPPGSDFVEYELALQARKAFINEGLQFYASAKQVDRRTALMFRKKKIEHLLRCLKMKQDGTLGRMPKKIKEESANVDTTTPV